MLPVRFEFAGNMMALQLLPILQLIVILCSPTSATYPIYGTKRYGRGQSAHRAQSSSWALPLQYQQYVRTQRLPMNYYDLYPYSQTYPDEYYYPQESISYPVYYAPARTSKYEVYQAVLPYYYNDRPVVRPGYGYYGYQDANDPVVDIEEEMLQEAEREAREENQPIGQEMYYENDQAKPTVDDTLDDVNAAFLQNLIMTQMYKDALDNQKYNVKYPTDGYYNLDDTYGKWEEYPIDPKMDYFQEDEDVKELKQLAKPRKPKQKQDRSGQDRMGQDRMGQDRTAQQEKKKPTQEDRMNYFQSPKSKNNKNEKKQKENIWNWEDKRSLFQPSLANKKEEFQKHGPSIYGTAFLAFSDRKALTKPNFPSTTASPSLATTKPPRRDARGGQKEEVLMRPATPVRHPFSDPVLDMMHKDDERKRTPSVYDTIKHMLDMEKSLEKNYDKPDIKPAMRKRIISSEESLTHQLSVLKKAQ